MIVAETNENKGEAWNQVSKAITIELNAVTAARLDRVAAARDKKPEAIVRQALSRYLQRYNRTNKLW